MEPDPETQPVAAEIRSRVAGTASVAQADASEIEVRATTADEQAAGADTTDLIFSGHAIVFDRMSDELGGRGYSFREKIARGAVRRALDENQDVVYLYDHEGLPLARTAAGTLELREDPRGLFVYARAAPTSVANDLAIAMRAGNVRHMSFAFTVADDTWEERTAEDGTVEVVRTVNQIDRLYDVSAVGQPAYPSTDASVRSITHTRALGRVSARFGLPTPPLPDTIAELGLTALAATGSVEHEARVASLRELQGRSKRRLTLAHRRF